MKLIYLIGSLRNPKIPQIGNSLREAGWLVFDDWHASGPNADDEWQRYENERGHGYHEALHGPFAEHAYNFDKGFLERASVGLLAMPAGRSSHLELGYLKGQGLPCYVFFEEAPERYDLMYRLIDGVYFDFDLLIATLESHK